jgi:DNA-binding transcriptional LysR family regulator
MNGAAMSPTLDLDQLKSFLAIADTGNFTKASEVVNKTQSAVSIQMKRLEEDLGKALFQRDGRNSKLTTEGERLVELARKLVAMNDEIVATYRKPALSGTVRFGTPDNYADLFLPEALGRFSRSHPMVMIEVECVSSYSLVERVKRGEIDLALVSFSCAEAMPGEILRQEKMNWVTSARHGVPAAPVLPLAASQPGCAWRKLASDALETVGRDYRVSLTSPNRSAIDAAVLQGLAVAALPEICMLPGMRILTEAEGFPPLGSIDIGLVHSTAKQSASVLALAQHIRESFGQNGAVRNAA